MKRPRLLDLFCGAGGCAVGYYRAGFDVVGVDIKPQKNYPFQFVCGDALEYLRECGGCFDVIHASPPCQTDTRLAKLHRAKGPEYDDRHQSLTAPTRDLLIACGKPYIVEGVEGAPLRNPFTLCGTMFNLRTECGAELRRHRLFETNWFDDLLAVPLCQHGSHRSIGITGTGNPMTGARKFSRKRTVTGNGHSPMDGRKTRVISVTGATPQQNTVRNLIRETFPVSAARAAMGIDWMASMKELSQAIPPAYTEWIGNQLMEHLR